MINIDQLRCPSCCSYFSFQNIPKKLKNCQHSICQKCLKTQINCPLDNVSIQMKKYGVKNFLTNTEILLELKDKEKQKRYPKFESLEENQSNESKQKTYQNSKTFEKNSFFDKCLLHSKTADLICKQDGVFICPNCALFGLHKGHQVISYDQLLKQIINITDQTYKVHQSFKQKCESIERQRINNYIQQTIRARRDIQARNIRSMFQKFVQKVRKQQKVALNNLDSLVNTSIKSLKLNIHDAQFDKKKQEWTKKVYSLTSIMENVYEFKSIEVALRYLNQNCQQSFLPKNGQYLIVQLNAYDNIIKKIIDQKSNSLKCLYNQSILKKTQNFCSYNPQYSDIVKEIEQKKRKMIENLSLKNQALVKIDKQTQQENAVLQQKKQDDELLLQNYKQEGQQPRYILNNQISFQQKFSIMKSQTNSVKTIQFTPFLDKQTSLQDMNESTIQNIIQIQKQIRSPQKITKQNENLSSKSINNRINENRMNNSKSKRPTSIKKVSEFEKSLANENIFFNHKVQRKALHSLNQNTKKIKKIDIPQKYQHVWQDAKNDRCQTIDLTNAELGDTAILNLTEKISKSQKIKSLKLIRNKITDQSIFNIISALRCTNVASLNLSQNNLTDKALQVLQLLDLGNLKTITLSLNKINARKVKQRIQSFKERGITLSI